MITANLNCDVNCGVALKLGSLMFKSNGLLGALHSGHEFCTFLEKIQC